MVLCVYSICSTGYRWCYVHVGYVVLCTYHIVHMLGMRCCVHNVLCDVVYALLCTYGIAHMLYIWCCVHVVHAVLCTYCTCDAMCRWSCVNFVHVALCTRGVVHMSCM